MSYPFGSNRRRPAFEFGAPEPNLTEGSYEGLFEPQNDIQNIRMASVLDQPPVDPYPQETAASERFRQLLEQQPERGDPGFMDKLAGAAAYLGNRQRNIPGGQTAAENAKYAGFNREMADWKAEIEPAQTAATLENTRNVNSRNLAALEVKERNDARRLDETERKNRAAEASRAIRDAAVTAKANGFEINVEGDRVMATNPITLKRVDLGPSGDMDERDKLILTGDQAQKRAETIAAAAAERNIASGAQLHVDAENNPVSVNPRAPEQPAVKIEGAGPIKRVPSGNRAPGEVAAARGDDLIRVRSMSAKALEAIKKDFLVMPKDSKGSPTLNPQIKLATGWSNWNPNRFKPESPEARAIAFQKNLKDLLTLSLIGEMKEQSRTGATGFGQLTGRELDVLESAASRLQWTLDDATITQELIQIMEKLEKIMQPGEGDPDGVATTPKPKMTPAEMLKKYGGG